MKGKVFFQQCFDCIFSLIVAVYGSSWEKRVPVLILVTIILVSVCFTHIGWKCSLDHIIWLVDTDITQEGHFHRFRM